MQFTFYRNNFYVVCLTIYLYVLHKIKFVTILRLTRWTKKTGILVDMAIIPLKSIRKGKVSGFRKIQLIQLASLRFAHLFFVNYTA